jgi:hypothetical protein
MMVFVDVVMPVTGMTGGVMVVMVMICYRK